MLHKVTLPYESLSFWCFEPLKPVISVGQALLLLIEAHSHAPETQNQLKRWYLEGFLARDLEVLGILQHEVLEPYEVSFEHEVVNQDASRRYFETHLAYHTLSAHLDALDIRSLTHYKNYLEAELSSISDEQTKAHTRRAIAGYSPRNSSYAYKESADYIWALSFGHPTFERFTLNQRRKMRTIVQCALLGGIVAANKPNLPIDIYGQGLYHPEHRGRALKHAPECGPIETARSKHMGIVRSHSPLPRNDIAQAEASIFSAIKPLETSIYNVHTLWVSYNFAHCVHPFINSISGIVLAQVKNMEALRQAQITSSYTHDRQAFEQYYRLFIATMIFGSGGHTLFEYVSPLSLPELTRQFTGIDIESTPITIGTLFGENNLEALEQALSETMEYNHRILDRECVHQELASRLADTLS